MSRPARHSFSQDEIVKEAQQWLKRKYGTFKSGDVDKYHERLGLLIDFVTDVVPKEDSE